MSASPIEIFDAALQLSETERLDLAARILETLPADGDFLSVDDPDLERELDRRFADRTGSIPWSVLRDET